MVTVRLPGENRRRSSPDERGDNAALTRARGGNAARALAETRRETRSCPCRRLRRTHGGERRGRRARVTYARSVCVYSETCARRRAWTRNSPRGRAAPSAIDRGTASPPFSGLEFRSLGFRRFGCGRPAPDPLDRRVNVTGRASMAFAHRVDPDGSRERVLGTRETRSMSYLW